MELTPATVTLHGYVPLAPSGRDKTPQMRLLSTNECPNSRPDWLTHPPACSEWSFTIFGYCQWCWDIGNVPETWAKRVEVYS